MVLLDGNSLTVEEVYRVAFGGEKVVISPETLSLLEKSRKALENHQLEKTIYGVNTGFGVLANKKVSEEKIEELQVNIVRSHAAGVGAPLPVELVRAVMLVRANSLCKGYSGIRPIVVERLIEFLNHDIVPVVPEQGSVGASGDLAPLAHIALALIGEGEVFYKGERSDTTDVLRTLNIDPLTLASKEGLSLLNGTAFMAGIGSCAVHIAERLFDEAITVAAMATDALKGSTSPFDLRVHKARPHPGQMYVAEKLLRALEGSEIRRSHLDCDRVQDPYTLRAIPQVYGAVYDTIQYVKKVLEIEINSATDNPLIFENGDAISGGNFHGEPIALVMDFLSIALTDMANMMERRIDRLVNPKLNDLPPFLTNGEEGLNSGYMIWQYTAAALASENKTLAHPSSADSIPTSGFQEDHVSMGAWGARKLWKIVNNWSQILAIETLLAYRAMYSKKSLKSGIEVEELYSQLKELIPEHTKDRYFGDDFKIALAVLKKRAGI
ncbi:histidine ammonia-lyase [Kosmotoga pacifica]|uniref:Histidine ammonia-lyase n=1 Tax=Kosmotoga pacifica TaxID=1330330 RepID=A0A0G2Z9G9_9BACT|nr:histidine ammonia-lyase [Kosmotoga pacifica]AKI96726.1 histidine ammonia-lyase [Kosmotoga pacifica]